MKPQDFQNEARELAPEALEALRSLLESGKPDVILSAAKEVLERAYGKAASTSHDPWEDEYAQVDVSSILGDDDEQDGTGEAAGGEGASPDG